MSETARSTKNHLFILFNGPPYSGKDTGAEYIEQQMQHHVKLTTQRLAAELKHRTHALYGLSQYRFDHFETVKDQPRDEFLGLEPRQAYINVAEKLFKPVHGKTVFADFVIKRLEEVTSSVVLVPDLGFPEEFERFIDTYGQNNVMLVKVHRPGCSFEGGNDSRKSIDTVDSNGNDIYPQTTVTTMLNDNDQKDIYLQQLYKQVDDFINKAMKRNHEYATNV